MGRLYKNNYVYFKLIVTYVEIVVLKYSVITRYIIENSQFLRKSKQNISNLSILYNVQ